MVDTDGVKKALEIQNFRSSVAQALFHVEGKPFSLHNYPMYTAIYDGNYNKLLLKTARQVAKSTTIANFILAQCIGQPHFKTYYVSPSQEQTRKFSHTRVAKVLTYSPDVRKGFLGPEAIDNVLLRLLKNGSEMAFTYALDNPDRARGFSADMCCFDSNAEVLTRQGWRRISAVTYDDEIADVDPDGTIEWNRPTNLIRRTHQGDMVTFEHTAMTLRVTGDHKMWVNYKVKHSPAYKTPDKWEFVEAGVLAATDRMGFKMTNRCKPPRVAIPSVKILPGCLHGYAVSRRDLHVPYTEFATLMGWYIAEGNLQRRSGAAVSAVLTQNEGRYAAEIVRCLDATGLTYSITRTHVETPKGKKSIRCRFLVNAPQLGQYCVPLGKARDKYIPDEFFAHPSLLAPLLKGLYLGDASYHKGEAWDQGTLRTRSRRLADDVHRAWAFLGRPAVVHTRMMPPREGAPPEPLYEVCAYQDDYVVFWRSEFDTKRRVTVEHVNGEEVYCFTVKHHRPVIRGGFGQRPIIAGQCFDEVQDMLYEPVVPVIEECMAASNYARSVYAGTPKTMENSIEFLWSLSSQTEWCMPCSGCNKLTFIDSPKSLGKFGPECLNCRKYLNPRNGRWIDMKPGAPIKGFHISQPIMPENVPASFVTTGDKEKAQERWDRLLFKQDNYGEVKFLNEVLGVSTSTGARLLTQEILQGLCATGPDEYEMTRLPMPNSLLGIRRTVAGVDWSGGGSEVKGSEGLYKSRTVLHIWGDPGDGRLKTMYYKIFPNGHPIGWIDEIVELCNAWGVQSICGDAGEGALANAMLREKLGPHRVLQLRYGAFSKPIDWNPNTLCYHADRTTLIDNYATFLTHSKAIYPKLTQMKPAIDDILNVYEETTQAGRKVWRHSPTAPDDALHAQLFGWIAWRVLCQDLKFY